jgi:hypothetical protein
MRYRLFLLLVGSMFCRAESLQPGDAVMTGFSGVKTPERSEQFPKSIRIPGRSYQSHYVDELFIDPEGASVVVHGLETNRDHLWDASILDTVTRMQIKAKKVGQVFGVTLDDAKIPNIYVTPTSFYGLNIVKADLPNELRFSGMEDHEAFITGDVDTRPERLILGSKTARWMEGQFGKGGTPGTVWKIDGRSGKVSRFAEITLDGVPNSGPALGNIAFDPVHRQFIVSDLDTGMIHRISMKGKLRDYLDHGLQVRKAMGLKPIVHNALFRADIKNINFDSTNRSTWGYAREGRIIYGLAVKYGRLYYAVYNGRNRPCEIWSAGLDKHGAFDNTYRFELLVKEAEKNLPITDMVLTDDGEMILAQRPPSQPSYAMKSFVEPEKAQVLRYHLKVPYDGKPNRWYPVAQEYGVGFEMPYRNGMGGIALGYNYDCNGTIVPRLCDKSLWIIGEDLRKNKEFSSILVRNGDGIQGMPRVLSDVNKPAWYALFDLYPQKEYRTKGRLGDVAIYRQHCVCKCNEVLYRRVMDGEGVKSPVLPESVTTPSPLLTGSPGMGLPGTGIGTLGAGAGGIPWILGVPLLVNCWTMPSLPFCEDEKPPLQSDKQCMLVKTSPPGPFLQSDGTSWQLPLYGIQSLNGMNIDSMKITPFSGVGGISNGPVFAVGTPMPILTGVTPGTDAILNLCGFDSSKVVPGKPYECCNVKVKFRIREWESDDDNQTLEVVQ